MSTMAVATDRSPWHGWGMAELDEGVNREPPAQAVVEQLLEHRRRFVAFVERRVGSAELAEEIVQEAFARGIDRVDQLRDGDSGVAWFYRVLRNAVTDSFRRRAADARRLEGFARELQSAAPAAETETAICQCVAALAQTLKPEYADVLRRVDIEGTAVKDYAEAHGITASNAAVRAFRARAALRKQVVRCCGACAEHGCLDCDCRHGASEGGEDAGPR